MSQFPFDTEVRLIRWSDSSTGGRTITLELLPPESGECHPFYGLPSGQKNGQRLRMTFELINDDETISRDPANAPLAGSRPPETTHKPSPSGANGAKDLARSMAAKTRYAELDETDKLIAKAAMLAKSQAFQVWAGFSTEADAKSWIRMKCGVESCKEFATSRMACDRFLRIVRHYELDYAGLPEVRG